MRFPEPLVAIAILSAYACRQSSVRPAGTDRALTAADARDAISASEPDSVSYSGCSLVWKSVLGDSTVLVARVDLRQLRDETVSVTPTVIAPHLMPPSRGFAVQLRTKPGGVRFVFRGALDSTVDTLATRAIIAAVDESTRAALYAGVVRAALHTCSSR